MSKKLQPKSKYETLDHNQDGIVSDEELARQKEIVELELREEKADSQRKMAWIALIAMLVYALIPLLPGISDKRLDTLAAFSDIYFLSMASIIGMFFGATAYMTKR